MLIYSWKFRSKTAKALSQTLGAKRIKHRNSRFKGRSSKVVLNYGATQLPLEVQKCQILNKPENVELCSNKIKFFQTVADTVRVPTWALTWNVASNWDSIVCRTIVNGHSGQGLVITTPDQYVPAPLYTKYQKKQQEYRVHIVRGEIIDYARKARTYSVPDDEVNWSVRTHNNGFIYRRQDVELPEDAKTQALLTFEKLGLDFVAVDVMMDQETAYVIEANSAPGMTGTTLERYSEALNCL